MEKFLNQIKKLFGAEDTGPQWGNIAGVAGLAALGGLLGLITSPLIGVLGLLIGGIVGGMLMGSDKVQDFFSTHFGGKSKTHQSAAEASHATEQSKLKGLGTVAAIDGVVVTGRIVAETGKAGLASLADGTSRILPESVKTAGRTIGNNLKEAVNLFRPAKTVAEATEVTAAAAIKAGAEAAAGAGIMAKAAPILKSGGKFLGIAGAGVTTVVDGGHAIDLLQEGKTRSGVAQALGTATEAGGMLLGPAGMAVGGAIHDALYIGDTLVGGKTYQGIYFPGEENMTRSAAATILKEAPVIGPALDKTVGAAARGLADAYYDYKIDGLQKSWNADAEEKAKTLINNFNDKDKGIIQQMVADARANGDENYSTLRAIFELTDKKEAQLSADARAKVAELMKGDNNHTRITAIYEVEKGHQPSANTHLAASKADPKNQRS